MKRLSILAFAGSLRLLLATNGGFLISLSLADFLNYAGACTGFLESLKSAFQIFAFLEPDFR